MAKMNTVATHKDISFTLNGRAVTAHAGNHQNLVELLQGQGLFGARESCAQGLCGCCTVIVGIAPPSVDHPTMRPWSSRPPTSALDVPGKTPRSTAV